VHPCQVTVASLKFLLPAGSPDAQWTVTLVPPGTNASMAPHATPQYTLNAPVPWWVQGDRQRYATPGARRIVPLLGYSCTEHHRAVAPKT
jgi:hypothetical protein